MSIMEDTASDVDRRECAPRLATSTVKIIECDETRHAEAILNILNEAIATSTALYDYQPRTLATMKTWFEAKRKASYPVVGVEDSSGQLLGFASYGAFR